MKKDFDAIIRQYGYDIFLQRRTQNSDEIPTYSEVLERHTVRSGMASSRSLMNSQDEMIEGLLGTSARIYYFLSDSNPYEGDRIYEVDFRSEKLQSVWLISHVFPQRGLDGHVVYWIVGVTRSKPN
jgi:hypothetical protein